MYFIKNSEEIKNSNFTFRSEFLLFFMSENKKHTILIVNSCILNEESSGNKFIKIRN